MFHVMNCEIETNSSVVNSFPAETRILFSVYGEKSVKIVDICRE